MITVSPVIVSGTEKVIALEIFVLSKDIEAFKEMVHRATNLWPDAPAEIKHFADLITNGKPMQDYFSNPNLAGKYSATNPDDIIAQYLQTR